MLVFVRFQQFYKAFNSFSVLSMKWVRLVSQKTIVPGKKMASSSRRRPNLARPLAQESIIDGPKEFEIIPTGSNPAFDYSSRDHGLHFKRTSEHVAFSQMGLRNDIIQALESQKISLPTVIQAQTIPEILKGKNVLCAAQTGSGKTFAYLLPILNIIKNEEDSGMMTRFQRPRVCIVAPFRELAIQILSVIKGISHSVPVRSLACIGGEKDGPMYKGFKTRPIDVIVGTPGTILDLLQKKKLSFKDLQYLVIDEADTMLDASFKDITKKLLSNASGSMYNSAGSQIDLHSRFVFATATVPKFGVLNEIKAAVKNIDVITSRLHHILPHVKYIFIKTLQPDKPGELVELLNRRISKEKKAVVFVNSTSTCNWLSNFLEKNSVSHLKLSGKDKPGERQRVFKKISAERSGILLCTDIVSRGLDFPDLFFVINYDCPLNPTDFIHRAGRTGRARAEYIGIPEVYTLLSKNWEVSLGRRIQSAALNKKEVDGITAIKRLPGPVELSR